MRSDAESIRPGDLLRCVRGPCVLNLSEYSVYFELADAHADGRLLICDTVCLCLDTIRPRTWVGSNTIHVLAGGLTGYVGVCNLERLEIPEVAE